MEFKIGKCSKCGRSSELMFSNNPLVTSVCFNCIKKELNFDNLEHADFFCRTFNIPFKPELWMNISAKIGDKVFKEYSQLFFDDETQPNLFYSTSTKDIWKMANSEWEKCRTQTMLLNRIEPLKDAYIERTRLKWGETYEFDELLRLDSTYISMIKANNITNPLQKEALKMLLKINIETNKAIIEGDTKAVKDFSTAYTNIAKAAQLDELIESTRTDDITTVAELYQFFEQSGFQFKYYDDYDRDEVDKALRDVKESNRRLVLEATGLTNLLEEMIKKQQMKAEEEKSEEVYADTSLDDLYEQYAPEEENDSEITDFNFSDSDN